ncbi:MAG: membrane protein YdbS with pleckstrin-like domain [Natronomonas sp.]|jgi:membrane protein YdbS with pleckstrin-like domain|uniref:PH domain-containing protein n=1 Tax=Natronomonas sp. TaxID=2184060 RepID=UPI00398A352E
MDDSDGAPAGDETTADATDDDPFGSELTPAVTKRDDGSGSGAATDVPEVEELVGPRQTLEPGIQTVWVLQTAFSALILGLITSVVFAFVSVGGPWIGVAVFTVVFLLGAVFSVLRYRSWSYEVREDSLYLERGVLTHVTTVVPHVRIQHVDASRGPVERAFGLATTVVYTAGSRGADVSIPGLTPERANDLQTRLKQLAIAAEGEDAV